MQQNPKSNPYTLYPQEFEAAGAVLALDAKNYHAWAHRQALAAAWGLWEDELAMVTALLADDVRNNSAWNHRFAIMAHRWGTACYKQDRPDLKDRCKAMVSGVHAQCTADWEGWDILPCCHIPQVMCSACSLWCTLMLVLSWSRTQSSEHCSCIPSWHGSLSSVLVSMCECRNTLSGCAIMHAGLLLAPLLTAPRPQQRKAHLPLTGW